MGQHLQAGCSLGPVVRSLWPSRCVMTRRRWRKYHNVEGDSQAWGGGLRLHPFSDPNQARSPCSVRPPSGPQNMVRPALPGALLPVALTSRLSLQAPLSEALLQFSSPGPALASPLHPPLPHPPCPTSCPLLTVFSGLPAWPPAGPRPRPRSSPLTVPAHPPPPAHGLRAPRQLQALCRNRISYMTPR